MNRISWRLKQQIQAMEDQGATNEAIIVILNDMLRRQEQYALRRGHYRSRNGRWIHQKPRQQADEIFTRWWT